jgi:predicted metalloprotease with PDZ domain
VDKAIYDVVIVSDGPFGGSKLDSLSEGIRKIVHAQTDFFHDTPFERYAFIVYAPTMKRIPSFAQGALEHANSSGYLLTNYNWPMFKGAFLSIFSHEFFHLWDVKRIHSSKLGPFDYTSRVKTTSLWMAEGITDYYAHALLPRYGITTPLQFYSDIQQWTYGLSHMPVAARTQSLEDLSIAESDFKLENAELFYIKGPLVGLMLDLEIRNRTNNARSLDDVMHALNADAKKGKTFTDEELIHKVGSIVGLDLTEFYKRYIAGTDSLPLDRYLSMMGLLRRSDASIASSMRFQDSNLVFGMLDPNSNVAMSGVREGDVLLAVNGSPVSVDDIESVSMLKNDSTAYPVLLRRNGQELTLTISPLPSRTTRKKVGPFEIDVNETRLQRAIRQSILGPTAAM